MRFNLKIINLNDIDFRDTKTQATMLIALLGVVAFILYIYYIFLPQVAKDVSLIEKTIKMKRNLTEARLLIAEKGSLKNRIEKHNEKIVLYENKLPAQNEVPTLLENLSRMARSANITIIGITPVALNAQKEKKRSVYQEIPIVITAKSGYHELGRFLSNLENGDRFVKVVDISVKANIATPKNHDVELMIYTYVLSGE